MNTIDKAQWSALIKDTILKELRSKTLLFIFIATTLMIILGHTLFRMFISSDPSAAVIDGPKSVSIMYALINGWSVIISAIFGIRGVEIVDSLHPTRFH